MNQIYTEIKLEDLHLDHINPRLPRSLQNKSDDDVINWMLSVDNLIELMLAIGNNGFFPGEPLLVINENGKNIVVEGNRRLASLKLLENPSIAKKRKRKVDLVIEEAEHSLDNAPEDIPCIVFNDRMDVNKYLGYRHVTGIKEWSVLAKARYLTALIPSLESTDPREKYKELAKSIGSRSDYVQRLLVAYELYEELENNNFYGITDLTEETIYFNYLTDSLNRNYIKEFIGIDLTSPDPLEKLKTIEKHQNNFTLLIKWFFDESRSGKTLIKGDSDNLSKLNKILSDKNATDFLIKTEQFNEAYDLLDFSRESFHQSLATSKKNLQDAMNKLYEFDELSDTDKKLLIDIEKLTRTIKKHFDMKE